MNQDRRINKYHRRKGLFYSLNQVSISNEEQDSTLHYFVTGTNSSCSPVSSVEGGTCETINDVLVNSSTSEDPVSIIITSQNLTLSTVLEISTTEKSSKYTISKDGDFDITIGEPGCLISYKNLTIENVNILLTSTPNKNILIQKAETLNISGVPSSSEDGTENIYTIIGMLDNAETADQIDLVNSLISIEEGASVELNYVKIQNVKSTNYVNGLGLKINLFSSCNLSLSNIQFNNLSTLGKGSALYVYYKETSFGEYHNITFNGCESNTSDNADYFYITVPSDVNLSDLKFVFKDLISQLSSEDQGIFYVNGGEKIDFMKGTVYVQELNSEQLTKCTLDYRCSISEAINATLKETGTITVKLVSSSDLSEVTELKGDSVTGYTFTKSTEPAAEPNTVITLKDGSFIASQNFSIYNLNIIIDQSQKSTAITQIAEKLTISGNLDSILNKPSYVTIGSSDNNINLFQLNNSLIVVKGEGKIDLSYVVIRNAKMENSRDAVYGTGLTLDYSLQTTDDFGSFTNVEFHEDTLSVGDKAKGNILFLKFSENQINETRDRKRRELIKSKISIVEAYSNNPEHIYYQVENIMKSPEDLYLPSEDILYIGGGRANDSSSCIKTSPCISLDVVIEQFDSSITKRTIIVQDYYAEINNDSVLSYPVTSYKIQGSDNTTTNITICKSGTVTVEVNTEMKDLRVNFTNITSNRIIIKVSKNNLTLNNIEFTPCNLSYSLISVEEEGTLITKESVTFIAKESDNITVKDSLIRIAYGGIAQIEGLDVEYIKCDVTSITGVVINAQISSTAANSFILNGSKFISSISSEESEYRGLVYLEYADCNTYSLYGEFTPTSTFSGRTSTGKGDYYYIVAINELTLEKVAEVLLKSILNSTLSSGQAYGAIPKVGENERDLRIYITDGSDAYIRLAASNDSNNCTDKDNLCSTLQRGFEVQIGDNKKSVYVVNSSILNLTSTLNQGTEYKLTREGTSETIVTVDNGNLVVSKKLSITYLTFNVLSLNASFISQSEGILSLSSVIIQSSDESNAKNIADSLIIVTNTVIIKDCTIKYLNVTDGVKNGGALNVALNTNETIEITNTNFDHIETTGSGGALYISYTDKNYGEFSGTTFTNCNATKNGKYYYVVVPVSEDLRNVASYFSSKGILSLETPNQSAYGVLGNDTSTEMDLMHYLPDPDSFFVGSKGNDNNDCTNNYTDGNLCKTLNKIIEIHRGDSGKTIYITDYVNLTSQLDISMSASSGTTKYNISSYSANVSINIYSSYITASQSLSLISINITIERIPASPNNIISQSNGTLTLSNLSIEGTNSSTGTSLDDSLIKIYSEGSIKISSVTIQNIKLVGSGKYGAAMTIDFSKWEVNNEGEFETIICNDLNFSSVNADGVNGHGDYYYFIFESGQISGNKPSEIKSDMKNKISAIEGIDEKGKIFYSLGGENDQKDLNAFIGPFYIEGLVNETCASNSIDPCTLSDAIKCCKSNSNTIIINESTIITFESITFTTLSIGYTLKIVSKDEKSITLGTLSSSEAGSQSEASPSLGLSASKNLNIENINIYVNNLASGTSAILQTSGILTIKGNSDKVVIIGQTSTRNKVDLSSSLISIRSGASLNLSYVKIQNVKSSIGTVNGLGLNIALAASNVNLSLSNVNFSNLSTLGKGAGFYIKSEGNLCGNFSSLNFNDGFSAGNNKGTHFYIVYPSMDNLKEAAKVYNKSETLSKDDGVTMGATDESGTNEFDLFYLFDISYYVNNTGGGDCSDNSSCLFGIALDKSTSFRSVVNISLKESITLTNSFTFKGYPTKYILTNDSKENLTITMNAASFSSEIALTILGLNINVTSNPESSSILTQHSNELNIRGGSTSIIIDGGRNNNDSSVSLSFPLIKVMSEARIYLSYVTIRNVQLSSGFGAVLDIDYTGIDSNAITFDSFKDDSNVTVEKNCYTCKDSKGVMILRFTASQFNNKTTKGDIRNEIQEKFENLTSYFSTPKTVYFLAPDIVSSPFDLHTPLSVLIIGGDDADDNSTCEENGTCGENKTCYCLSLNCAVGRFDESIRNKTIKVISSNSKITEECSLMDADLFTIYGNESASITVKENGTIIVYVTTNITTLNISFESNYPSGILFSILKSASLLLNNVGFILNGTNEIKASFINVADGATLIINKSVSVNGSSDNSATVKDSLIKIYSGGKAHIEGLNVTDVKCDVAGKNGIVINAQVSASSADSFSIIDCSFKNCNYTVDDSYGGVIYLEYLDNNNYSSYGIFTPKSNFSDCEARKSGEFYYVVVKDTATLSAVVDTMKNSLLNISINVGQAVGYISTPGKNGKDFTDYIITYILLDGSSSSSDSYCGRNNKTCCKTLSNALASVDSLITNKKLILFNNTSTNNTAILSDHVQFIKSDATYEVKGISSNDSIIEVNETGHITFERTSKLTNLSFIFNDGAIPYNTLFIVNKETLTLNCIVFSNIDLTKSLISVATGATLMIESSFVFDSSSSSVNLKESLIIIQSGGKMDADSLNICGINLVGNGAAVNALIADGATFKIKNSNFSKCNVTDGSNSHRTLNKAPTVKGLGGAIYIQTSLLDNINILLNNITFSGNSAHNNSTGGRDVFIYTPSFEKFTVANNFPFLKSNDNNYDGACGIDDTINDNDKLVNILGNKSDKEAVYVRNDGSDSDNVSSPGDGTESNPYKTINCAFTHIEGKSKILILSNTLDSEKSSTSFDKSVEIRHEFLETFVNLTVNALTDENNKTYLFLLSPESPSDNEYTLSVEYIIFILGDNDPHLTIVNIVGGKVVMDHCKILGVTQPSNLTYPAVSATGGSLNITSCIFSNLTMNVTGKKGSAVNAVYKEKGNITIKKSTFETCKNSLDDGGAIFVEFGANSNIQIGDSSESTVKCVFKDCYAGQDNSSGKRGGGICIKIDKPSDNIFGNISVQNIQFGDESHTNNSNVAKYGNNMFVESYNFTSSIVNKSIFPVIEEYISSPSSLMGCWSDYADGVVKYYNLADLLIDDDKNRYVGNNGDDKNNGYLHTPYQTINKAYDYLGNLSTIKVLDDLIQDLAQLEFNKEVSIEPYDPEGQVSLNVSQLVNSSNPEVPLIIFTINTLDKNVKFTRINFKIKHDSSTAPKESVLSIKSGIVEINNCVFENHTDKSVTSDTSLIKSTIVISGGNTTFTSCMFKNLVLSVENGAAISASLEDPSSSLIINGETTFDGCRSTSGNGGAIHVKLSNGTLNIGETGPVIFKNCAANSTNGLGGAIYLDIITENISLFISNNVLFGVDNSFQGGQNEGNSASTNGGEDIFVSLSIIVNISIVQSYFPCADDSSSKTKQVYKVCDCEIGYLYDLVHSSINKVYVDGNSESNIDCIASCKGCSFETALKYVDSETLPGAFYIRNYTLSSEQKLGGNNDAKAESYTFQNKEDKSFLNLTQSGSLTATKNFTISKLNIFVLENLIGNSAISINGAYDLILEEVTIGGEKDKVEIHDSLIKVIGGASVNLTSVTIQFINLTDGLGAGLFIDCTGKNAGQYGVFSTVNFDNTFASGNGKASLFYIILDSSDNIETLKSTLKDSLMSQVKEVTQAYAKIASDGEETDLFEVNYYVSSTETGNKDCSTTNDACLLRTAVEKVKGSEGGYIIIEDTVTITSEGQEFNEGSYGYIIRKGNSGAFNMDAGYFTSERNLFISSLNIILSTKPSANVFSQSNGTLTLSNLSIGGTDSKTGISLDDSLIKIYNEGSIKISSVTIQNIKLVGSGKYGAAMTIDFSKWEVNNEGEFETIICNDLNFSSVNADGVNGHGDYYYFIFESGQISGNKPSEIKSDMKNKISAIEGIDEKGKIFYSLGGENDQKDLNAFIGPFYIEGLVNETCANNSIDECYLTDAISAATNESYTIVLTKDSNISNDAVIKFNNKEAPEDFILKNNGTVVSLTLGLNNSSAGFEADKNLTIIEVNIYIVKLKGSALTQTGGTLTIKGEASSEGGQRANEATPVYFGGKNENVTIDSSLITVLNGAKLKLYDVKIQNLNAGANVYGAGFYLDASIVAVTNGDYSNVIFENCSVTQESGKLHGNWYFIKVSSSEGLNALVSVIKDNLLTGETPNEAAVAEYNDNGIQYVDLRNLYITNLYASNDGENDYCSLDNPCCLIDAFNKEGVHGNIKIYITSDITLKGREINFSDTSISGESYEIANTENHVINLGLNSESFGGFVSSKNITINNISIIVGTGQKSTVFDQSGGLLMIKGSDSSNFVIIGGESTLAKANSLTGSIIKVREGANLILENVKIQNAEINGNVNGLGIYAEIGNGNLFSVKSTTFENLTLSEGQKGVCMYLDFKETEGYGYFDQVNFSECKAGSADNYYYMKIDNLQSATNELRQSILSVNTPDGAAIGNNSSKDVDLKLYLPIANSFFIGTGGTDEEHDCTNRQSDGNLCKSLNYGFSKQAGVSTTTVYVISESILSSPLTLDQESEYKLTKDETSIPIDENPEIKAYNTYLIVSKNLSISYITFSIVSINSGMSFISQSSGLLSLNNTIISGADQNNPLSLQDSLISIKNGAGVSIDSSALKNIIVTGEKDGGGLNIDLSESGNLKVCNTTFENITINGKGAGFFIRYNGVNWGDFKSEVVFKSCVSKSEKGDYYYVTTNNEEELKNLALKYKECGILSKREYDGAKMGAINLDFSNEINLKLLIYNLYVSMHGSNDNNCESLNYACKTIAGAYSKILDGESIILTGSCQPEEMSTTFEKSISLISNNSSSKAILSVKNIEGSTSLFFMKANQKKLIINSIMFQLSAVDISLSVVSISDGELLLESCSFGGITPENTNITRLTLPLINMDGGNFNLSQTDFNSISLSNASAVFVTGGVVFLDSVSFKNISTVEGNGTAMKITGNESSIFNMTLKSGVFEECRSEQGWGGALYIYLVNGCNLLIGNDQIEEKKNEESENSVVKFVKCNTSVKGGAIYIYVCDNGSKLLVNNCEFGDNVANDTNNDIYVEAYSLKEVVNSESFIILDSSGNNSAKIEGNDIGSNKVVDLSIESATSKTSKSSNDSDTFIKVLIATIVIVIVIVLIILIASYQISKNNQEKTNNYEMDDDNDVEDGDRIVYIPEKM